LIKTMGKGGGGGKKGGATKKVSTWLKLTPRGVLTRWRQCQYDEGEKVLDTQKTIRGEQENKRGEGKKKMNHTQKKTEKNKKTRKKGETRKMKGFLGWGDTVRGRGVHWKKRAFHNLSKNTGEKGERGSQK